MSFASWDVVIVGAGPSGLATALFLLARAPGLEGRVCVVDRATHPREKICAGAIGDRAERCLRAIGVDVDVPSCPIRGIAVTTREGTLVVRGSDAVGRVVRRREFDAGLARAAEARGVVLRQSALVRGLTRRGAGMEVELDGEHLRARVVVGADGVGSFVRRAMGAGRGALLAQVAEVDTARLATDLDEDVLHFDLRDQALRGYSWDFPTPLEGTRASRGTYELRVAGRSDEVDVGRRLERRVGSVERLGPVKRFSERGIAWHEPMSWPRVLLVGEAAGIDPVLGEGIAQAILYGHRAAEYLAPRLVEDDLGFPDWRAFVRRSRLGLDLSTRAIAAPLVYGVGRRGLERWVRRSEALASLGLAYFGGKRVERADLLRAALDLGGAAWERSSRST